MVLKFTQAMVHVLNSIEALRCQEFHAVSLLTVQIVFASFLLDQRQHGDISALEQACFGRLPVTTLIKILC